MIVFITILSTLSTFQSLPEDQAAYEEIVEQATFNCPRIRNPEKVNQKLLWELVNIEREFNGPPVYRGMLLAAACHESGYNPDARGDRKFSKKRKPKAIGLLQFWKWAEKYIDRTNPIESARFWRKRIKRQIPFIKKKCRWRSEKRIWLAAWGTAIRYPKKSGTCYEKPKHYYQLKKWKKPIEKKRKKGPSC